MKQALLIIDVQNDYFVGGKKPLFEPEKALTSIINWQTEFRQKQLPIFYIQHIKQDKNADFFAKDSDGAKLHGQLLPMQENECLITKSFPNSFWKTDLQQKLQQQNVEQLVIVGMMTHMCIDSTVRHAAELGYQPIVIANGCATSDLVLFDHVVSAKDVQTAFLASLTNFAKVMLN